MKKITKFSYMLTFLFVVAFSQCIVYADTDTDTGVLKEYNLTVTAKDINDNTIPNKYKEITDHGKKYRAKKINYKIEKEDTIVKKYNLNEDIPKEITENGKRYILDQNKTEEEKTERTDTYYNYVMEPDIPHEKNFEINGKECKGTLKDVTKTISTDYNVPFSIPAKFFGSPNTEIYILNGKEIAAYNAPEFKDYDNELLAYLNLDGNIYKIQQGQWSSDYYTDTNGETIRNAIFNGLQKSHIYTAVYDVKLQNNIATYINPEEIEVKASIEYEKAGLSPKAKIIIAFATLVGAIMIVLIFIAIRKNIKQGKENV